MEVDAVFDLPGRRSLGIFEDVLEFIAQSIPVRGGDQVPRTS